MKNLLIFYAILSVSTFAGNRKIRQLENAPKENPDLHGLVPSQTEMMSPSAPIKNPVFQALTAEIMQVGNYEIQHLANIFNDYDNMAFVVSASVSKDSGRIEKILIDTYDRNYFLGRKSLEMESFLRDGFIQTINETEIFSIQEIGFDPKNGGLLELQYLEDYYRDRYASVNFSLLKNKDDGVWMLTNENGQRINIVKTTVDTRYSSSTVLQDLSMSTEPLSKSTQNPVLKIPVTTKIGSYLETFSMVLEFSPEGEIYAIYFDIHRFNHSGRHRKKRILLKNLFEETFTSPEGQQISPISLHPLDFNPRDGGTFAIRYKNRRFFELFNTSKEVIMSLIKSKGEWVLADKEGRPINKLSVITFDSRIVKEIIADMGTSTERKLKIRSCKESARALLL